MRAPRTVARAARNCNFEQYAPRAARGASMNVSKRAARTYMTMRSRRLHFAIAVAIWAIPVTGCQQLQAVFTPRPSENMPVYKPVDVQAVNQNWSPDQQKWF